MHMPMDVIVLRVRDKQIWTNESFTFVWTLLTVCIIVFYVEFQDDGDLPLHLLVRSGSATQVTVELLIRPIMCNPTICSYPGSSGVNLPLHSKS